MKTCVVRIYNLSPFCLSSFWNVKSNRCQQNYLQYFTINFNGQTLMHQGSKCRICSSLAASDLFKNPTLMFFYMNHNQDYIQESLHCSGCPPLVVTRGITLKNPSVALMFFCSPNLSRLPFYNWSYQWNFPPRVFSKMCRYSVRFKRPAQNSRNYLRWLTKLEITWGIFV